jgi:hypothetical protein
LVPLVLQLEQVFVLIAPAEVVPVQVLPIILPDGVKILVANVPLQRLDADTVEPL